ncbi:MAG: glycosyltransferase family 4 protein [Chloroflexi bacterium]|nr:glycosyltransferase family 4 protein [Chloroflexota bacterium]
MHVALNGWFWDQPHTGSGQYVRHLLAALTTLAPELRLSLIVPEQMHQLDHLPPKVDVLPMRVPIGGQIGKVWFEQRSFPRAVARLQADLAHVPYWGPPLRISTPLVATVLDVIPLAVPEYRQGLKNRLYTSLVRAAARGATHILTISEDARQGIQRLIDVPGERISVTPLAAEARFQPEGTPAEDNAVRARYDLPDDFVLYLGSYAVHKNIRLLAAAYTYVAPAVGADVPLVLAGNTPAAWGTPRFPDIPAYLRELGLTADQVHWIGPVAEADKPALYRLAKVFAFPSRYEGFGLGPLEAMASGTPVVACAVSSVPEVTGDAAYLVDPNDSKAFGGAILALLLDDTLADQMRQRGLVRARAFSWQQTAQSTLDVYRYAASYA